MGEQVADHVVREPEAALARVGRERLRLVHVCQRHDFEHQTQRGIILGNVLNSASLSLDSFLGAVGRERQAIEARLAKFKAGKA